jgi:hypothetical protein
MDLRPSVAGGQRRRFRHGWSRGESSRSERPPKRIVGGGGSILAGLRVVGFGERAAEHGLELVLGLTREIAVG